MKTMLIPVDFTETSNHTVTYAIEWAKRYEYTRIILLKTFYDSMFEKLTISAEFAQVNQDYQREDRENAEAQLNELVEQTLLFAGSSMSIEPYVSELHLVRAVKHLIDMEQPELVVLGSDANGSSDGGVARNLIPIAKISSARVLIVPAAAEYKEVRTALVPLDFNLVHTLFKLTNLRQSDYWQEVTLMVLNVDPKQLHLQPDEKRIETENALHQYLENFRHELYYEKEKDVIQGILNFTASHSTDVILALPGNRSFLYALTHQSISEAMYRNARLPVLILK